MRRLVLFVLLYLCSCFCSAGGSTITYAIVVSTTGNTFSANYTLTLDPTLSYTNATAGLVVNSLNAGVQGASGFTYDPGSGPYSLSPLTIGGLYGGVTTAISGSNDYYVSILLFPTTPSFNGAVVVQASGVGNRSSQGGIVTVTQVAITPEPSSVVLLATGLVGVGLALRRSLPRQFA